MKTGEFVWTVAADYTDGRIPIDDTLGAMSVCLFKVNDGLEYQPYSPEDSRIWADEVYRPQGIDWMPWGVARGWNHDIAREEGRLAGRHAAASRSEYVLDLEPYKEDYWQGIPGTPRAFCEGYEEQSNGIKLRLCPDARNVGINLEEWVQEPVVGIWHPQAYYTAFASQDFRVGIMSAIRPLLNAGVPRSVIYPVLPLWLATTGEPSIPPDDIERDLRWLASEGYPGSVYWRRGVMDGRQVERLLAMEDPFTPTPPPPVPVPKYELISQLEDLDEDLHEILEYARTKL